jgi:hypothetical protein
VGRAFAKYTKTTILHTVKSIEIDTFFGNKPVHIEIGATMGAGGGFYVRLNKYYNGRIWKTDDGWRHDLNPKTILQGDDVAVIIELIERDWV